MAAVQNIIQLRQLLAQRFGGVWALPEAPPTKPAAYISTGLPQLDEGLGGGLPKSHITELVSPVPQLGSALVLRWLVQQLSRQGLWVALVDGQDSFDPTGLDQAALDRLLWVRCQQAVPALQATDLLVRDGQAPVVVLDLRLNPARQLRAIPQSAWYRLQRVLELTPTALVVIVAQSLVAGAYARVWVGGSFGLDALDQPAAALVGRLQVQVQARRGAIEPAEWVGAYAG